MRFTEARSAVAWHAMHAYSAVLFDLDGTLIDTRAGILGSWTAALDSLGLKPAVELDDRLLAPTAAEVSLLLVGDSDGASAQHLLAAFVEQYDEWGWKQSEPFPGVADSLQELVVNDVRTHLVTNKRGTAARRILQALGWIDWFQSIHCCDDEPGKVRNKIDSIGRALDQWSLSPDNAVYVGDTAQDRQAAQAHGLRFIPAWWGYFNRSRLTAPTPLRTELETILERP